MSRRVYVDWIAHPGRRPAVQVYRDVGWSGLEHLLGGLCVQLPLTVNAQTLTEQAAVGVMAVLIHALEGAALQSVLPIGSGGDYFVLRRRAKTPTQVEVSGVRDDSTGAASRARLAQKTAQVLTKSKVGYASVTTFSHPVGQVVHSYLHSVHRGGKKKGGNKGKKK